MFRRPSQKNTCRTQQQQQQQQPQTHSSGKYGRSEAQQSAPKPKRTSSILGKLMRRTSSSANTVAKNVEIPSQQSPLLPMLPAEPSSPALSSNSQFSSYSSLSSFSERSSSFGTLLPHAHEKLPSDWELRYDTMLCQFYYVNTTENIVQFDSPLEVLTH